MKIELDLKKYVSDAEVKKEMTRLQRENSRLKFRVNGLHEEVRRLQRDHSEKVSKILQKGEAVLSFYEKVKDLAAELLDKEPD